MIIITSWQMHVQRIVRALAGLVYAKYDRGQQEHGGQLWEKGGMLTHVQDELIDQCVYLITLRDQLQEVQGELRLCHSGRALELLDKILGEAEP